MVERCHHNIIVEEPVVEYDYPWWYGGYGGYDYASSWNEPSHHHSGWDILEVMAEQDTVVLEGEDTVQGVIIRN